MLGFAQWRLLPRSVVIALMVALILLLVATVLWSSTSVGCVPTPLPHWLPRGVQFQLEMRCGS